MPDREKVIKALTDALTAKENYPWGKAEMSFEFIEILLQLLKEDCHNCKLECLLQKYDELKEKHDALLKEQEAVTIKKTKEHGFGVYGGICPKCRNWIQSAHSFCGFCGQGVKWE